MVGEAFAGLSALKTAFDLAKGLKDINDAANRNAAVIELQEKILGARQAQSELVERVEELEKENARLKEWQVERERYELKEIATGAFVYAPKDTMRGHEPMHWLCANCFQNGKKRFLQAHRNDLRHIYHKCQECGGEVRVAKPESNTSVPSAVNPRYDPFRRR